MRQARSGLPFLWPVTQTAAGKPFSRPRYHKRRPSSRSAGPGNANGGRQAVQPAPVSQTAAVNPFSRPRYHKRRPSTRSAGPGNTNGGRQPAQPAPVTQTAAVNPLSRPPYLSISRPKQKTGPQAGFQCSILFPETRRSSEYLVINAFVGFYFFDQALQPQLFQFVQQQAAAPFEYCFQFVEADDFE